MEHIFVRDPSTKGSSQNTLPPPLYVPVPWNEMTASSFIHGLT